MTIEVCIGSSCHLKGSHEIIELLKSSIEENGLSGSVELKGAFCLGKCSLNGVSIKVDDEIVSGVTKENFSVFFKNNVLKG